MDKMKKQFQIACVLLLISLVVSCSPKVSEIPILPSNHPSFSPIPEASATAALTSVPTHTTAPTGTPVPTSTPIPEISFINGNIPINASEISIILESGEIDLLEMLHDLAICHLEGSTCYDEIVEYSSLHPNIIFTYNVQLFGSTYSPDTTLIHVSSSNWSSSDIYNAFRWIPSLEIIDFDGATLSVSKCEELKPFLGISVINYKVSVGSLALNSDVESVDLKNAPDVSVDELIAAIPFLPNLSYVSLPKSNSITLEDVGRLQQSKPGLVVDYPVTIYGKNFSTADTYIVLSKKKIKVKQLSELKSIMPYMTNCEKVIMEDCGLSDEVMDELRTELSPYAEVVWRIRCGPYSCRTDAIMIKFSGKSTVLTDSKATALKYCHDVIYLDLGHNHLRHIDFVANMPNLEVCIIAVNYLVDITPIQYCKKLEYCEFLSNVSIDVSPLSSCTNLRHLNISFCNVTDITPLYGLVNLERLWISRNHIPADQISTIKELLPNTEINTTSHNPTGEGWRENPRYDLLRLQFRYDNSRIRSCYIMDGEIIEDDTK